MEYQRKLRKNWGIVGHLYYDQYDYDATFVYDYSETETPFIVVNSDIAHAKSLGGELKLTRTLFEKHDLSVGTEARYDFQQDQRNYDRDPFNLILDDYRTANLWALYLQDDFAVRKDLTLSLGIRHDHYETFGGTTNPRLALIYHPFAKTSLKLLYGGAFRAPNAFELYYQGWGQETNLGLKPETIRTGEVVLEQYIGKRLRIRASGFQYDLKGVISQQTDLTNGLLQYRNIERVKGNGMEFEIAGKAALGIEGRASYTLQQSENKTIEDVPDNSPQHLAQINLTVPLVQKKIFAGFDLIYMSNRRTFTGYQSPGYVLPNLTLFSQRFLKGFEVSTTVYNLFNTNYGDPADGSHPEEIIYQNGRSIRIKVGYHF